MPDEPHTCYECERNGPFKPHPTQLSEQLRAFTAPMWRPPQTVETERLDNVWDDTREYIRQHWIAPADEEHLYDGLTAFAISTWLKSTLKFVPHAMIIGPMDRREDASAEYSRPRELPQRCVRRYVGGRRLPGHTEEWEKEALALTGADDLDAVREDLRER